MNRIIKKLAKLWCKLDDSIDHLFQHKIMNSNNGIIIFIMCFISVIGLVIASIYPFPALANSILFFFIYIFIAFIGLIVMATYYEKERIKNSRLYPFQYVAIKWEAVNYELLKFNKEELIDFNLLLNRRHVQNKINFREKNKSKEGANHRMLFSMFHVLMQDGIDQFTDIQKEIIFDMLWDSFLINEKPINKDTLKSSFSNWKGDLSTKKGIAYNQYWKNIFSLS